ncbi:MAG TPA: bifunctional DNA-formamidopyrimidine glycosylase/DNA-(apurinic or apyrimidinic site) lyase [Rhizobiales bacterium]|nr:formamidopyrimidine-DNA glycosylase [bacterium BMS3Bbin10]HDO52075.1 bifunctional DNA-formamidopyrimidine glycosylase/DNA-(apurinic or apyrimidinic site) lyase [Hyphomicrobiales bacterium]
MPELPEVETVRRGLESVLVDARFERVEQRRANLRFPFPERFAERLTGRRITALGRRAKYLLAHLESEEVLIMHLGMSGRFTIRRPGANAQNRSEFLHEAGGRDRHDHVVFTMSNGATVTYNDARRFGFMALAGAKTLEAHRLIANLGVEPLSADLSPRYLAERCGPKKTSLKAALLDQRIVAGLGNIYVCEALYRARLSPRRSAGTLALRSGAPSAGARRLVPEIKSVLEDAIGAGGSTLKDYHAPEGDLGYFQHSFAVYGREGLECGRPGCEGTIRRIVQGGRSSFYCPGCQR